MTREDIIKLPKVELHCHLDGSLSREFVEKRLGRQVGKEELSVSNDCTSLAEYLEKFDLPGQCLQDEEGLEEAGYDVLRSMKQENVIYSEIRFAPLLSETDNCAMQLVHNPGQFDVILTENMFGDILSDEASMVTGSIGMLSSASLNETSFGLYEPSHGSAPDIAGKGIANPIATILSAAMLLRYSLNLDKEADAVETAVQAVLKEGYRTGDIMSEGCTQVGTVQMGDLIAERIH